MSQIQYRSFVSGSPADLDIYKENDNTVIDLYDSDGFICAGITVKPNGEVFWHFPLSGATGTETAEPVHEWSEEAEKLLKEQLLHGFNA